MAPVVLPVHLQYWRTRVADIIKIIMRKNDLDNRYRRNLHVLVLQHGVRPTPEDFPVNNRDDRQSADKQLPVELLL